MRDCTQPIGIFDSGLGGISVLKELRACMPQEHFLYYGDSAFAPYGTKSKEEIIERCLFICDTFIKQKVKAIVIACNSATSVAVDVLRARYDIPIVGMEPALKMAAHNKSNQNIIVMATPLTLKEEKFARLMSHYSEDNHIIKLACPELVDIVERNALDDTTLVIHQLQTYFTNIDMQNVDSIVLGCTHFVYYKHYLQDAFAHIQIIDGNVGTCMHLLHILEDRNNRNTGGGSVQITNSSPDKKYIDLSYSLLERE